MPQPYLRTFYLALLMLSALTAEAFVSHPHQFAKPATTITPRSFDNKSTNYHLTSSGVAAVSSTRLQAQVNDGSGRGVPILLIVLLGCVWMFTIPPEFRRAYICPDACAKVENQAAPTCQTCITGEEWVNGIKEYYANGGGIQWDFSIDPNSKMKL